MPLEEMLKFAPTFVLVLVRLTGMILFAPLFGSTRIPRRVRGLFLIILAFGLTPSITTPVNLPPTLWQIALGMAGELIFGATLGLILSFAFVAAQWAGEIIGQQLGFNLSESFDPEFGARGSLVGDLYFYLTIFIFLAIRGHHLLLRGIRASFDSLPLLSVGMDRPLLDTFVGLFHACTILTFQLIAPVIVTMLAVDLALGFLSKTIPQINVMSAGLTLRSILGMLVAIVGLSLTNRVIRDALYDSMQTAWSLWTIPTTQ